MKWSIHSFKPYKSPGPDGITPAHIQQAGQIAINWLKKIYQSILAVGDLTTAWQESKVVFIPKAGKATHTTAKDFRPISLDWCDVPSRPRARIWLLAAIEAPEDILFMLQE